MRIEYFLLLVIGVFVIGGVNVTAQDKASNTKLQTVSGIAKVVGKEKIVLENEKGKIDTILTQTTAYFRLPPDNLKLSAAVDAQLSEISAGDRILVAGTYADNSRDFFAVKIYLVKAADIAQQQAKQIQEWRMRGVSGRVIGVDTEAKVITIEMRGILGTATTLKISPKNEVKYLRYSTESVKYSDALKSEFSEIQEDDMIQALGDKSEDGLSLQAEEILSGSFVTIAGKVKSVDKEKNEVTVTDLKTKKDVTIAVNKNSLLKKFPEEQAQQMARFMGMMQSGARPPQGQPGGQNREGRRGDGPGGGMGQMNINDLLNRFPTISVADLTEGEMIAVSSPKGKDETRLTAIKLLAGVEPFIAIASMSAGRTGGRGGVSGSLNIPGLDGLDF